MITRNDGLVKWDWAWCWFVYWYTQTVFVSGTDLLFLHTITSISHSYYFGLTGVGLHDFVSLLANLSLLLSPLISIYLPSIIYTFLFKEIKRYIIIAIGIIGGGRGSRRYRESMNIWSWDLGSRNGNITLLFLPMYRYHIFGVWNSGYNQYQVFYIWFLNFPYNRFTLVHLVH